MSRLDTLPTELLDEIAARLCGEDKKDLSALSFSSKRLRDVVEPHLYRDVKFGYDNRQPNFRRGIPIHLLLRTLVHRPELCSLIRCLELGSDAEYSTLIDCKVDLWFFWGPGQGPDFSDAVMSLAVALVHSLNPPAKSEWIQGLYEGSFKFCTALMLSQLVKLKTLCLHAMFCKPDGFIPLVFDYRDTISMQRRFPSLEHVVKDVCSPGARRYHLATFLPFFYLPSIKHLSLVIPSEGIPRVHRIPPISTLTSLVVEGTGRSMKNLGRILRQTPNLKSLKIYHEYVTDDPKVYDCGKLGHLLRPVQDCLERLALSIQFLNYGADEPDTWEPIYCGRINSLKHFTRLLELDVPAVTLLGWNLLNEDNLSDVLPSTLRQLRLSDDVLSISESMLWGHSELFASVRDYIKGRAIHTPGLEAFSLRMHNFGDEEFAQGRLELRETCAEVGVMLQYFWDDDIEAQRPFGANTDDDDDDDDGDHDHEEEENPIYDSEDEEQVADAEPVVDTENGDGDV